MKKLLILLTVVLAVSLSACGEKDTVGNKEENTNTPAPTEAVNTLNPINLCDGKLYGGMPEADAMSYMGSELGLTKTKYVDSSEFTHAFYLADDWYGLGETLIDVQSKDGKLKYVEFIFQETTNADLITELSNRFGGEYETKEYSTYKKHTWSFSDAHATLMAYDEERDTISFFVTYLEATK